LLLGVDGICIISHGSSQAPSIFNAIRFAKEAVDHRVLERIQAQYQQVTATDGQPSLSRQSETTESGE
jgi:phosphate acyltransferase